MVSKLYCAEKRENDIFVLEPFDGGEVIEISVSDYGCEISDSDVVRVTFCENGEIADVWVDEEETGKRKQQIKKRLRSLFDN